MIATRVGELDVAVQGQGPVAVLWHSLYVDDGSWDRVAPGLSRTRRLVRITGPGHGRSAPRTEPFTIDDCAGAALDILSALHIEDRVDWIGNAWGGHVGVAFAATHPERVRTLAVFNAPMQPLAASEARSAKLAERILRYVGAIGPVRSGVTKALLSETTRRDDPDAVAYVDGCLRAADPRALANAIRSVSLTRPDLRPLLPGVSAPTLLVTTRDSVLWPRPLVAAASASMPNSTVACARGGHLTPLESPDETMILVAELWARA